LSFADGWTTDDLQYLWKPKDPVQIVPDLHLPRFTLEKYINAYCNIKTNTGKKILLRKREEKEENLQCFPMCAKYNNNICSSEK